MGFDEIWNSTTLLTDQFNKSLTIQQAKEEARVVYDRLEKIHPMHLLEIGAGAGGSHRLWMDASPQGADLVIIDWHSVVTEDIFLSWKKWYKPGQTTTLFYDSQKQETFDGVKAHLGAAKLDFLFIDGDHHYECAKRDFDWYGSLVRSGGIIGIHDTQARTGLGKLVGDWWIDFRKDHAVEEVVMPEKPCGTGIYYVPISGT